MRVIKDVSIITDMFFIERVFQYRTNERIYYNLSQQGKVSITREKLTVDICFICNIFGTVLGMGSKSEDKLE